VFELVYPILFFINLAFGDGQIRAKEFLSYS